MQELAPGLYRWTARHPAWEPGAEPDSPGDWSPDVGCVAYAAPGALLLIDPLVADWAPLDALARDRSVTVLTTMRFHSRSREEVADRYGARLLSHTEPPPLGVKRIPIEGADESMVYLEVPKALVCGDRLIGDGRGGLRPCPDSWLRYIPLQQPALRAALAPLLELPVELVLPSHGDPVLRGARAALEKALAADGGEA